VSFRAIEKKKERERKRMRLTSRGSLMALSVALIVLTVMRFYVATPAEPCHLGDIQPDRACPVCPVLPPPPPSPPPTAITILDHPENTVLSFAGSELIVSPCSVPCKIVRGADRSREADAIFIVMTWWHPSRVARPLPPRDHPQQLYLGFAMETPAFYPWLARPSFTNQFNLTVGYPHFAAEETHVHISFGPHPFRSTSPFYSGQYNFSEAFRQPVLPRPGLVSWFASNCNARIKRMEFVKELMQHVPVHAYGYCLHNADLPVPDVGEDYQSNDHNKIRVLRNHTFDLALENSNCVDYVTEKVWQALTAGTVPIYMGTPSIEQLLPHPDAILRVSDFPTTAALADYIRRAHADPSLLAKHHAWRTMPHASWPMGFHQIYESSRKNQEERTLECTLCESVVLARTRKEILQAHPYPPCHPYPIPT
jgi:hypothetical protein